MCLLHVYDACVGLFGGGGRVKWSGVMCEAMYKKSVLTPCV